MLVPPTKKLMLSPRRHGGVLAGFLYLALCDFALRVWGLRGIYWLLKRNSAFQRQLYAVDQVKYLCHSIDAAASLYLFTAWCLTKSAAAVLLLRQYGIPSTLVLGVRKLPFRAHAWVEFKGAAIYPESAVSEYRVIDRITSVRGAET